MKPPCRNCLVLAICRAKVKQPTWTIPCPLIKEYIQSPIFILHKCENEMYMRNRLNKVRKALGLKKLHKVKRRTYE